MNHNSFFGFCALAVYVLTLIPSNMAKIFPHTKRWRIVKFFIDCNHRRFWGLTAFALAINHALISIAKYDIDFLQLTTYARYYTGVSTLIIFFILALTSNNWSIKKLKKNWKLLHQLTYVAMLLLLWHIWILMKNNWSWLTPIAIHLICITIVLSLTRLIISAVNKKKKEPMHYQIRILQTLPERSRKQNAIDGDIEVSYIVKLRNPNLFENE